MSIDVLQRIMDEKLEVKVYLKDRLDRYSINTVNGNISLDNLSRKLASKLKEFEKLTENKELGLYSQVYFQDFLEECEMVGIYPNMEFRYLLSCSNLVIDGIYNNFILLRSVDTKIPYTILKSDLHNTKMVIKNKIRKGDDFVE